MKQPKVTTHLTDEPNRVEIRVGGWAFDCHVLDGGLRVDVYSRAGRYEGLVAVAYDGTCLDHDEHVELCLDGSERP